MRCECCTFVSCPHGYQQKKMLKDITYHFYMQIYSFFSLLKLFLISKQR